VGIAQSVFPASPAPGDGLPAIDFFDHLKKLGAGQYITGSGPRFTNTSPVLDDAGVHWVDGDENNEPTRGFADIEFSSNDKLHVEFNKGYQRFLTPVVKIKITKDHTGNNPKVLFNEKATERGTIRLENIFPPSKNGGIIYYTDAYFSFGGSFGSKAILSTNAFYLTDVSFCIYSKNRKWQTQAFYDNKGGLVTGEIVVEDPSSTNDRPIYQKYTYKYKGRRVVSISRYAKFSNGETKETDFTPGGKLKQIITRNKNGVLLLFETYAPNEDKIMFAASLSGPIDNNYGYDVSYEGRNVSVSLTQEDAINKADPVTVFTRKYGELTHKSYNKSGQMDKTTQTITLTVEYEGQNYEMHVKETKFEIARGDDGTTHVVEHNVVMDDNFNAFPGDKIYLANSCHKVSAWYIDKTMILQKTIRSQGYFPSKQKDDGIKFTTTEYLSSLDLEAHLFLFGGVMQKLDVFYILADAPILTISPDVEEGKYKVEEKFDGGETYFVSVPDLISKLEKDSGYFSIEAVLDVFKEQISSATAELAKRKGTFMRIVRDRISVLASKDVVNNIKNASLKTNAGDFEGAVSDYTNALKKVSQEDSYTAAYIHCNRGIVYYRLKQNASAQKDLLVAYNILKSVHYSSAQTDATIDYLLSIAAYVLGSVEAEFKYYKKANEYQREAKALGYRGPKYGEEDIDEVYKILRDVETAEINLEDLNRLLYDGLLNTFLESRISAENSMQLIHALMILLGNGENPNMFIKFQDILADNNRGEISFESADITDWNKDNGEDILKKLDDAKLGDKNIDDLLKLLFSDGKYYLKVFNALTEDAEKESDPKVKSDKLYKLIGFSLVLTYFAAQRTDLIRDALSENKDVLQHSIAYEIARFGGKVLAESYKYERTEAGINVGFKVDDKMDKAKGEYYRKVKYAVEGGRP